MGFFDSIAKIITSPVAAIGSAVIGGIASDKASDSQSDAAQQAADAQVRAAQLTVDEQRRQYDQTRADQLPWLNTGTDARYMLGDLLGIRSRVDNYPTRPQTGVEDYDNKLMAYYDRLAELTGYGPRPTEQTTPAPVAQSSTDIPDWYRNMQARQQDGNEPDPEWTPSQPWPYVGKTYTAPEQTPQPTADQAQSYEDQLAAWQSGLDQEWANREQELGYRPQSSNFGYLGSNKMYPTINVNQTRRLPLSYYNR